MNDDVKAAALVVVKARIREALPTAGPTMALQTWEFDVLLAHIDGEDARRAAAVAAAREEQREACVQAIDALNPMECESDGVYLAVEAVRTVTLSATPLADRIAELERSEALFAATAKACEKAEAERDEWRRQLRDAERYAAEQEMAYADLTAELAMVRAAGKELTLEFEGVEAERGALRAQVHAARAVCEAVRCGSDCDSSNCYDSECLAARSVLAAMDGAAK